MKKLEARGKLPPHITTRGGGNPLYIYLGMVNLATLWFEGLKQHIAFSGRPVLADRWCWTRRIAGEQRRLARVKRARTSRNLRKLYRIRHRRFEHTLNAMVKK